MRAFVRMASLVAFTAFVPSLAHAQASITGVVRDSSGAVLPGVTVEAASPALIEKVRSAATESNGQYRIENLRPGTYTVTFTLPGFATVVREGLELAGSFTATINADLRVGGLEETITVTGESPIVDVQSTLRQRVMDHEVIDAIPSSRSDRGLALLVPGVTVGLGSQDVGGTMDQRTATMSVHGSRGNDQRIMQNGVSIGITAAGGANSLNSPNMSAYQEVQVETAAVSAELASGGVRVNFVPKDGGNNFSGTMFATFANESFVGNNFTDELKAAGLGTPDGLKQVWDYNPGFGGPIKRDKVWFYVAYKNVGHDTYPAASYVNRNANNPNAWTYDPELSSRPFNHLDSWDLQGRVTTQATQKLKIGFSWQETRTCFCSSSINATTSPEAALYRPTPALRNIMGDWTMPLTNKVLVDGSFVRRVQDQARRVPPGTHPDMISVTEQALGNLVYRTVNPAGGNPPLRETVFKTLYIRSAVSYITGAHAVKAGVTVGSALEDDDYRYGTQPLSYRFNNGVPNQITLYAYPVKTLMKYDSNSESGAFVQDRWTIGRLTATYGLRYDYYKTSFPEQTAGPTVLLPNRNISLPAAPGVSWHDLTPKSGAAYDLFGNGKTALKVSLNKYVAGQGNAGEFGRPHNPINRLVNITTRAWTDTNGNFVPDCNLTNPDLNGECGAMANRNFGQSNTTGAAEYDPDVLSGWGIRSYNWEFSAGVQQQVAPRVSVDVSYFRRSFGNFFVTDNRAVGPGDFTEFRVTAPDTDSRLPAAGQVIGGYYNLNPDKVGQVNDFITRSSNYGDQREAWNGVDVTVNARLQNGLLMQGGTSTGRTSLNTCELRARLPETALTNPFCDTVTPFLTQVKFLASYIVPRIGVQVSGTVQSLPGPVADANFVASNALVAPSLGRPLSGGAANVTVSLLEPASLYADRVNQVDMRVGKIVRFRGMRTSVNLDIYNALNSGAVLGINTTFNPAIPTLWQRPQSILLARLFKVSMQFDF
jgi:hypothetical protein